MIELLVSISVFSVIVAIVSGIFITSLRSNRTSLALISANSDGQLALEQMTRMIRKGIDFKVDKVDFDDNPVTYDQLKYKCLSFEYGDKFITYRWNKPGPNKANKFEYGKLEVRIADSGSLKCSGLGDIAPAVFNEIISQNLKVDFADFRIVGQSVGDPFPLITIVLRVGDKKVPIISDRAFINLQTSVSARQDGRY